MDPDKEAVAAAAAAEAANKVTVKNVGDQDYKLGDDVTVEAGKEAEVDRDLAVSQLGDPNSTTAGDIELRRVQTIWGFYGGFEPDNAWTDAAPKLEVYDSDGNRLWLLHDDPTGEQRAAAEEATPKKQAAPKK